MSYEKINGNPYRQAGDVAKQWNKSKRNNYKKFSVYKNNVAGDAEKVKRYCLEYWGKTKTVRHRDEQIRENILEAIHLAKYLRELTLRLK